MKELLTAEAFRALGAPTLVYVRPVRAAEIMGQIPKEKIGEHSIEPDTVLYAVCRADGQQLAVITTRDSAFEAAIAHELAPVSVH